MPRAPLLAVHQLTLSKTRRTSGGALLGNQAELACPGDRLGAVSRAELAEDMADVFIDRVEGDHKLLGDGLVRRACG